MRCHHSYVVAFLSCLCLQKLQSSLASALPYAFSPLSDLHLIGSSFGIPGANASFDYVVIGGGTAGLVIATRLAQNKSSVAVIEAGGFAEVDNGNLSVIPADAVYFSGSSPEDTQPLVDWSFVTTPQAVFENTRPKLPSRFAKGHAKSGQRELDVTDCGTGHQRPFSTLYSGQDPWRKVFWSQSFVYIDGKNIWYAERNAELIFHFSSTRNYMAYQRGTIDSYDMWASEVGDDSYRWDNFLEYFQKSVNFTPANNDIRAPNASAPYNPAAFSTSGGPLHVSFPNWGTPFASWYSMALQSMGLEVVTDAVSGALDGITFQMNTLNPIDQTRSSSETSFLQQGFVERTLSVYKNSLAKKIIFDDSKKATGVLVDTQGAQYTLSANKEVILSGGAFGSPQMLMVSGIGPEETLNAHDIPVISSLPGVGQNLWDHWFFGPNYQVDVTTHSSDGNPEFLASATEQYLNNQTGILTNAGADIFAWEQMSPEARGNLSTSTQEALQMFPPDWPEIEYLALDAYAGDLENFIEGSPKTPYNYVATMAVIVQPLSRGNVTIQSDDTSDAPLISPNWLSDPADQELALYGFKRIRQAMESPAIQPVLIGEEVYPGRNVSSDSDILEAIKDDGACLFHASCTCKMGQPNDTMAVVDTHGRVFGVEGLRVVDVSAFPFLPPGHPQATVYALAEKMADVMISGE